MAQAAEACPHEGARSGERWLIAAQPRGVWGRLLALLAGRPQATWLCRECLETMQELVAQRPARQVVHDRLSALGYEESEIKTFWHDLKGAAA